MTDDEKRAIQEKHQRTKAILKIVGPIVLGVGIIMVIIGFVDFFSAMGRFGAPKFFWLFFAGFPFLGIGGVLTMTAFRSEIVSYHTREAAPVINEFSENVVPAVKNFASAVKEGISGTKDTALICPTCGEKNQTDAKFCNTCGAPLKSVCTKCGEENAPASMFCKACGEKL
ncbi:MAG: zinc ribbon domain-containing protein [Clostridiales bacterium]|nr:zinc ribbon domain-containing protein [Clostridiales bacterium]